MTSKKTQIKQQIVATVVITFMVFMVFGAQDAAFAVNQTNTTLIQNLVAGALQLEATDTLGFSDVTVGVAANSTANLTIINARDYRGSGAGWAVTAVMNALTTTAAGTNTITNDVIAWAPGDFFGLDGASNTGVALGTAGYFDTQRTLINTDTAAGMGNYKVVNTMVNVVYNGRAIQLTGTYQNTLTMTIN